MKLVVFSDIHSDYNFSLPEGDVLIYCGDFSGYGTMQDIIVFNKFLIDNKDKYKDILVVYGNHETQVENNLDVSRALFTGCKTLTDEAITIGGIKFYGTPWTKEFYNWAFMKPEEELKEIFKQIPDDTDVLISHGPAYGILDKNGHGECCGSAALRDRIREVKPKVFCFGHIHDAYAKRKYQGTTFINCSLLDDQYQMKNKPVIIEL
jgi:Icc-related predicted phosphoesterase